MLKVGITGGIGGGKSTFSEMLRNRGFLVYDTDKEAKRLQNNDMNLKKAIIGEFGNNSYLNNELNRPYIAQIVFNQPDMLKKLNNLVHPVVKHDILRWYAKNMDQKILFIECAILYEGGFDALTDKNILITASENIRIQRIIKRDGLNIEQIQSRIQNQLSDNYKKSRADFIIHTDKGLTKEMLDDIINQLN